MTQATSKTDIEKLDKKFKVAQAYLTTNGFSRSIKNLFEDMERCQKNTKNIFLNSIELN